MSAHTRVRLSVTGVVQGVGFRPTVARIAAAHRLGGFVLNDAGSVQCELEGPGVRVEAAVQDLRDAPPPLAHVDTFVVTTRPVLGERVFRISTAPRAVTTAGGPSSRPTSRRARTACGSCSTRPTGGTVTRSSRARTAGRATR